jgi:hypothetical protein
MRFQTVITTLSLAIPALAATELKVEQYDGPTECDDDKKVRLILLFRFLIFFRISPNPLEK